VGPGCGGGLALTVLTVVGLVVDKERVRAGGTPMWVELAPADPRAPFQGDFMRLDYEIVRQGAPVGAEEVVVELDEDGVAYRVRWAGPADPANPHELRIDLERSGRHARLATDGFLFEEGSAERWSEARYGQLRVMPSGRAVLVGLADEARQPLSAPRRRW